MFNVQASSICDYVYIPTRIQNANHYVACGNGCTIYVLENRESIKAQRKFLWFEFLWKNHVQYHVIVYTCWSKTFWTDNLAKAIFAVYVFFSSHEAKNANILI